jgi:hypothetical protein
MKIQQNVVCFGWKSMILRIRDKVTGAESWYMHLWKYSYVLQEITELGNLQLHNCVDCINRYLTIFRLISVNWSRLECRSIETPFPQIVVGCTRWNTVNQMTWHVGFEVLTAVVMTSIIFWDMTPCSQLSFNRRFGGTYSLHLLACCFFFCTYFFDPEDGGDMLLRNVGWNSTDYTASYPRI